MTEKVQQLVGSILEDLLKKLEVQATVVVAERDNAMWVEIESEDQGILIGHHGRSLEALQILLGQLVYKKLGMWVRIVVTVGDYRERREQQLNELAQTTAAQVVATSAPVSLPQLTPAERRIVHMALAEHPEVVSESVGEGRSRTLVVKLKA